MITQPQECFEEWLQIHDFDYEYSFYTPDEWRKRGEKYLCDSALIFASENQLMEFMHYGSGEGDLEEELQDLAEGFGYYFEFGNHWNFGFYSREGLPPLPARGAAYATLLADDRWQRKRKRIAKRSGCVCEDCGAEKPLDVHHCYYRFGRFPWQYPDASLLHLCRDCHQARQKAEPKMRGFLPQVTTSELGILRKALRDGMYWYPRREFWAFIDSIGYKADQMLLLVSDLRSLRSHRDDRDDKRPSSERSVGTKPPI